MDYIRLLTQARLLHTDLRTSRPSAETEGERSALYKAVRKKLDLFYAAAGDVSRDRPAVTLFSATRELILDAMYHIGLSENGFHRRYDLLEHSVKGLSH